MYQIRNFFDNDDVKVIDSLGAFSVIEYQKDLSVMPETAMQAYFASQMNVRKRQVVCDIAKSNVTVQEMVNGYLAFARGETPEIEQATELPPMLIRIARDA
ncbi:MAG: hypothetical protein II311_05075, partial [Lachnospiraceae bacterium]|nr:hypothetical protein [Lachnospiraceae bacterium]